MNKVIITMLTSLLVMACQQENFEGEKQVVQEVPSVSLTKDHIIRFDSQQTLENFMKSKMYSNSFTRADLTNKEPDIYIDEVPCIPAEFETISDLKEKVLENESSMPDDSELSIDEYNLLKAENILMDPLLTEFMDTTLRVQVGDTIYKVCEYGTFAATSLDKIEKAMANFDHSLAQEDASLTIDLGNGVTYVNTSASNNEEVSEEYIECDDEYGDPSLKLADNTNVNTSRFDGPYNVVSYKWKNNSVWQKFWDHFRGKNVTKHNKFSSSRRMMFKVFQCKFPFYTATGVKVEMQKRRHFLGVSYWAYTKSKKLAIGFNYVYGHMKLNTPQYYIGIQTATSGWPSYNVTLDNLTSRYLMGVFNKLNFPQGWTNKIFCAIPEIKFNGQTVINRQELNKLSNKGFEQGCKAVLGLVGKTIGMDKIGERDPKIAYGIWGPNDIKFSEQNPFLTGVVEYNNMSSKSVYFAQSWGFTINLGFNSNGKFGFVGISGNTVASFKIDAIDAFGAVYYDEKWKGIRMYSK